MISLLCILSFLALWYFVSKNYYHWKTSWELRQSIKDLKNTKKQVTTGKAYKDVDELLEDLNKKDKWYIELWRTIRIDFERFIEIPRDAEQKIVFAYQRITRKWSDDAVWSIDWYLTEILPPMLLKLKNSDKGHPCSVKNKKEWDKILDSISLTFNIARQIQENHWTYQESNKYSEKIAEKYRDLQKELKESKPDLYEENFGYVMTKEECKVYEKGWANFQKYFFNLWW